MTAKKVLNILIKVFLCPAIARIKNIWQWFYPIIVGKQIKIVTTQVARVQERDMEAYQRLEDLVVCTLR